MEVITFERSAYEELMADFKSFVAQMKAMGNRGSEKRMGDWLDNQDVCLQLSISQRTLQTLRDNGTLAYSQIQHKTYYKAEDVDRILTRVEDMKKDAVIRKRNRQQKCGKA